MAAIILRRAKGLSLLAALKSLREKPEICVAKIDTFVLITGETVSVLDTIVLRVVCPQVEVGVCFKSV